MKRTYCFGVVLAALALQACGGQGILGEAGEELDGQDASADETAPPGVTGSPSGTGSGTPADDATSDDAAQDNAAPDDALPSDDASDDSPTEDTASDDGATPDDFGPIDDAPSDDASDDAPADDDDVAADDTDAPDDAPTPDDDSALPDDSTSSDAGAEPGPTDPEPYEPCAGLACGDPCNACPPDVVCILGPGYCDLQGQCTQAATSCGVEPECPASCPVGDVCVMCDDGSCAAPQFECNPDGSCGATTWECADEPEPEPVACAPECPLPAVCQACDDGGCAAALCAAGSTCEVIDWQCPAKACSIAADCGEYQGEAPCVQCDDPAESGCPAFACVEEVCRVQFPQCLEDYDPCADKAEGDLCQLCPPTSPTCGETGEIKACQQGVCSSLVSMPEQ